MQYYVIGKANSHAQRESKVPVHSKGKGLRMVARLLGKHRWVEARLEDAQGNRVRTDDEGGEGA